MKFQRIITVILILEVLVIAWLLTGCIVIGSNNSLTAKGAGFSSRSAFDSPDAIRGMEGGATLTPNTSLTPVP